MKKIFFLIPILFSFLISTAQDVSVNIKAQAEKMVTAFKDENYSDLLDYTYPKILEIAGGKEVLESMVKQMMDGMKADGVFVDSATVGEPGAIFEDMELINSTGELVKKWTNVPTKFWFDTGKFANGMYYLKVKTNIQSETIPLLIQR